MMARSRPKPGVPGEDARIIKTRAALSGAVLALTAEKDFSEITIGEIAERAGIGYATFFRHYPDKETLLTDVAGLLLDELLALLLPALMQNDTLEASMALCRFVDARRPICHALLAGGAEGRIRQYVLERATLQVPALVLPSKLPPTLAVFHGVNATLGLLAWWLGPDGGLSVKTMSTLINRLVLAPLRA